MKRTDRDVEILKVLATKIRFLTVEQAATWWDGSHAAASARRRLGQLADAGFVTPSRVRADPMLDLAAPVFTWAPGQPDPDFRALSNTLRTRWPDVQPVLFTVYRATRVTNNRFGGPARPKPLAADQVTHDLHVSAIFLRLARINPIAAASWIGEDVLGKAGYRLKDPDALIRYDGGRELVIEFGGRYDVERVRDFHRDCAQRERPYELW